jgi:hypothetical protein
MIAEVCATFTTSNGYKKRDTGPASEKFRSADR